MPILVIVAGAPGTGKTTIARRLGLELSLPSVHKDVLKERLYDVLKASTLEDSKMIGRYAISLFYSMIKDFLHQNVSFIAESPFSYDVDDVMLDDTIPLDYEVLTVVCSCDESVRQKRIQDRLLSGERHEAHHDGDRVHKDRRIDYSGMPGRKVLVNTTNRSIEETMEYLLIEIKKQP